MLRYSSATSKIVKIKDNTSAHGAAQSMPTMPNCNANHTTSGTRNNTSRETDRRVALTDFPTDCRKILLAFCTQHSSIPPKKIRKQRCAYRSYSALSFPNSVTMYCGKSSNNNPRPHRIRCGRGIAFAKKNAQSFSDYAPKKL